MYKNFLFSRMLSNSAWFAVLVGLMSLSLLASAADKKSDQKKADSASAKAGSKAVPKAQWASLLQKLDRAESQGKDQKGMMELVLINKAGKKRVRRAIFFQKGSSKRLIQFKYPASEAGLTVLIRDGNIMLYLPQFRRVRRVANHVKNQPFMGSDLNMDDMSTIAYSTTHTMISAHQLANGYRLVLKPNKGDYSKLVIGLRKDHLLRKIVYFNKEGKAIKQMKRGDFRKVNGYLFPHRLTVKDLRTGHKTVVNMSKVAMDSGISNKYFSTRYLKRELDL